MSHRPTVHPSPARTGWSSPSSAEPGPRQRAAGHPRACPTGALASTVGRSPCQRAPPVLHCCCGHQPHWNSIPSAAGGGWRAGTAPCPCQQGCALPARRVHSQFPALLSFHVTALLLLPSNITLPAPECSESQSPLGGSHRRLPGMTAYHELKQEGDV